MNLDTFQLLLDEPGQRALSEAMQLGATEAAFLSHYDKLAKRYSAGVAKAALETAILRQKARSKFEPAEKMYFTREALEVASGDLAARHRARRFSSLESVADLGCGIGGDTLAFARAGLSVLGIEQDPLHAAMARANVLALGWQDRVRIQEGDVLSIDLREARAAFADPARRENGRRHLDPDEYLPSLSALRSRFPSDFPLAVKLAPGLPWQSLAGLDAELEFVSVEGELKECVAWFGPLRTAARRATLLPGGTTLAADSENLPLITSEPRGFVFDPDPSIVRAKLEGQLGRELGLYALDPGIALFTAADRVESPFLRAYRIEMAARYHPGRLRDHLRSAQVGRVTFMKRGSAIDTETLGRKIRPSGSEHRVVILTRVYGEETMLIGERA